MLKCCNTTLLQAIADSAKADNSLALLFLQTDYLHQDEIFKYQITNQIMIQLDIHDLQTQSQLFLLIVAQMKDNL